MNTGLRSKTVAGAISILAIITVIGFTVPITSYFIDEKIFDDLFGIDKFSSVGFGIILVATCGGIMMALLIRRNACFRYYRNLYCKRTGEKMYEEGNDLLCPSHGIVDNDIYNENKHFEYLNESELKLKLEKIKIEKNRRKKHSVYDTDMIRKAQEIYDYQNKDESYHGHSHSGGGSDRWARKSDRPNKAQLLNKIDELETRLKELSDTENESWQA